MNQENLLTAIERATEIPVCPHCHFPIITGQLTRNFDAEHLICPTAKEAREIYRRTK